MSRPCIKAYPVEDFDGNVEQIHIEFEVHYVILGLVRCTPMWYRKQNGEIFMIPDGRRTWISTSGIGWFKLDQL